jgi:hypothetical protein
MKHQLNKSQFRHLSAGLLAIILASTSGSAGAVVVDTVIGPFNPETGVVIGDTLTPIENNIQTPFSPGPGNNGFAPPTPTLPTPVIDTVIGPFNPDGGNNGGTDVNAVPLLPPDFPVVDLDPGASGPTPPGGNGGGSTPPAQVSPPTEILQSSVIPPAGGFNPPAQDLFLPGAGVGGGAPLSPDQLGALAPAAGGNAGQGGLNANDESIACMNSYLQNGWASAEQKSRCGGESGDASL